MTHSETPPVGRNSWLAFSVLLIGAFMALLDTTIVNIALPSIRDDLGASNATLTWVISGYALAFGLTLIPAGWVGDHRGHARLFVAGLSIFTLMSLACAMSQSSGQLIAARIAQGFGGGIMFTSIVALIQVLFPLKQRARAFSIFAMTIGVATALGPLAGGVILDVVESNSGWRYVFGVNLPIGAAALVAVPFALSGSHDRVRRSVSPDWLGFALLLAGLVGMLVPLIQGGEAGWPAWTFASVAGGVGLLVVLAGAELRLERAGGAPLMPPRLFRNRSFSGGVVLVLVYFAAFTSIFFTLALLWQSGLDRSPLRTGLVLLPFSIGTILGAGQSERYAARIGRNVLTAGLLLVAAGLSALWVVFRYVSADRLEDWHLLLPLFMAGIGSGLFIAPSLDFILAVVERADVGIASGIVGTAQRIGSSVGIALIGTVLFGTLDFSKGVAQGFLDSAASATGVSALLAWLSLVLVSTLPRSAPQ